MEAKEQIKPLAVYSSQEVAELLGVSQLSIQRYVRDGKLKATVFGRKYLITGEAVLYFLGVKHPHAVMGNESEKQKDQEKE